MTSTTPLPAAPSAPRTLVWDAPVRIFHWLMVASFATAYVTAESDRWQLLHVTAGYTMAGLVAFRLVWGWIGTRHARFSSFVRGPAAVLHYLRSLIQGHPEPHAGHNPAGALAILALLALAVATAAAGWATWNGFGGDAMEDVHELLANTMLFVVMAHVAGVVAGSLLHGDNLVAAMVHGRKAVLPREGIGRAWRGVAAALLAAVLAFWWIQWQAAPGELAARAAATQERDHDDDD